MLYGWFLEPQQKDRTKQWNRRQNSYSLLSLSLLALLYNNLEVDRTLFLEQCININIFIYIYIYLKTWWGFFEIQYPVISLLFDKGSLILHIHVHTYIYIFTYIYIYYTHRCIHICICNKHYVYIYTHNICTYSRPRLAM